MTGRTVSDTLYLITRGKGNERGGEGFHTRQGTIRGGDLKTPCHPKGRRGTTLFKGDSKKA